MPFSNEEASDSEYAETTARRPRLRKRIRLTSKNIQAVEFPLHPLLSALRTSHSDEDTENNFENILNPFLQDFMQARTAQENKLIETNEEGKRIRPLRPAELSSLISNLHITPELSPTEAILARRLKLERERHLAAVKSPQIEAPDTILTPIPPNTYHTLPIKPEVLDGLNNIRTTPFHNSFLSRLEGARVYAPPGLLSVDWETRTPWMDLMSDIHAHYVLAHPDRECLIEEPAPITYSTLHENQLPQVNDLLERSFWSGIDVADSLDYFPEKSTVVAMYKKNVVGIAIINSPIETYITYLAVKAGWDKAQIARTMLYHLIDMNPTRDFTLHVSTNNSAMLLYNQFGFKAEKFVAGFYSSYLDPNSRASKNAFMLRLRHI
ncbi:hypothetical protein BDN70DRAFT_927463 [Pholiota conissans]|uniref:N-acetyltransferase domain-containing protein n=1 Tax=Pholiota conissans TaxID=109636 RepID=A0A9P5ZEI4_9AGAR|nr:hypothetical protein BDN70DRAFT_927463 [Pholiota conissans]